ncbi:MAG: acyl-CoA dehydratase activase-related protein [Christensenellales bacterium]
MIVTIPRMGNTCLAAKTLFEGLKISCVIPEKNNKKTLQMGSYLSPEDICLPFKIMMGNYIECIKKGADTIIITGSCGPCRFGEYCELQMNILKKLGLRVDIVVIDSPTEIGKDEFLRRIEKISGASPLGTIEKINALRRSLRILSLADRINAKARYLSGYEINKGECKRILYECETKVYKCNDPVFSLKLLEKYEYMIDNVRIDNTKNPIKVALIGEIYSMIEPFSNLFIEEKLMDYGVCTTRLITPSWWIKDLVLKPVKLNSLNVKASAKRYLPVGVGGHARESIAHAVLSKRKKADGAIQIFPLGCMPEIVTKAVLPIVQKEHNLPIMSLIMDEITGEAGYVTRIEAFLDMLKARKTKGRI